MNVAICDDEITMQNTLASLINKYMRERHTEIYISKFSNGNELLRSDKEFDIIFMDYQMDEIDGIKTSKHLRDRHISSIIIFVSAFPEIVFRTFEVDTFRFLVKPIDESKFFESLDSYRKKLASESFLYIKSDNNTRKIRQSEILYIEAAKNHSIVRTINNTFEINKTLKDIEKELKPNKFIRCHKSYIVGFQHIMNHTNEEIVFDNGEKSLIGKSFLQVFKREFCTYVMEKSFDD